MRLEDKEQVEIEYWRRSPTEAPGVESLENLLNKLTDAPVLLERLRPFTEHFARARRIIELGAGQGWASCLVKRLWPAAEVIATDISPHALASISQWEKLWGAKIDGAHACRSYETGLESGSADVIFCFAAAHHFVAHRRTLREVARVLRPGGRCFFLHEPSCLRVFHPLAVRRVNRIRPAVPEDVLVRGKIAALAREAGLTPRLHHDTSLLKRGSLETAYYLALRAALWAVPPLARLLPCTVDYEFIKAE